MSLWSPRVEGTGGIKSGSGLRIHHDSQVGLAGDRDVTVVQSGPLQAGISCSYSHHPSSDDKDRPGS